ncbi:3-hydroxyacyl-CoA dehydrogenase [Dethiosulfatibacter aminovorans DSM 17477]|uniref:3-hydroxyacyl-CoA dehydrogenase n=1 Tax=Dethiosulfatibacter aminovorans DSM 17477 TaxID=1121476 RepID=A0A1M6HS56_9FIRM|nr:3-hydroxybutyryl-CoA dehydrogenase [Dethiosulfatibacter aminovorans]SHJ24985.1 3-hydroxyacyl-CoA dehydrogenase [Dethiosulfatibacter aminovorans DSM 17477]
MKICILGAGTMGSGIAQVFAQNGHEVVLRDIKEEFVEKGYSFIEKNLARMVKKEKITENEKAEILNMIKPTTVLQEAADCDLVVEAAVENMKIKKEIFSELDKICGEKTILATNTSSLSITDIAVSTNRPDKVIGMHFFNPAPVMKLVEIIKGLSTSDETFAAVKELTGSLGKEGVAVEEAPGFVVNRILVPMINEAVGILADGIASAEDIDNAMKLGANHPIGPLALGDLIGLDVCLFIMEILNNEYGDPKYRPHPLLRKMVRGNKLGRKTGEGFFNYREKVLVGAK